MSELDLGNWEPLGPEEIADLLRSARAPWWIAGGYAIDAFVGSFARRPHDDIDVGFLARDQEAIRASLPGWELFCADPPGALRAWREGELLHEPIHDVWGRPTPLDPWRVALVLNPSEGETWIYRRDERVRRAVSDIVFEHAGIRYLVPEIQLLFKSKGIRPKDERDFADALPLLAPEQRRWLRKTLRLTSPGHPWLARL